MLTRAHSPDAATAAPSDSGGGYDSTMSAWSVAGWVMWRTHRSRADGSMSSSWPTARGEAPGQDTGGAATPRVRPGAQLSRMGQVSSLHLLSLSSLTMYWLLFVPFLVCFFVSALFLSKSKCRVLENTLRDEEELRVILGDSIGNMELMRKRWRHV